ncbi:GGDEF domain-containing protein [Cognatishimia sp. F0-27]|uniref:GGDEF domain-containing protein n=1 Tax=Cognatishimia sp. F0-27 TaxID=2816855 RepID=UPI001D0C1896|nr:GGDEF domain-containing protein [Cognatishimia sp. F0-27]MCC1492172.1 GGDEF domain-containing protein [Cognatishimia sp. F0-27]
MTIPATALHSLCPMHVIVLNDGTIKQAGPTLCKMLGRDPCGEQFFDTFLLSRPRSVDSVAEMACAVGRKLHLTLRGGPPIPLKGHVVPLDDTGSLINISFGFAVSQGVRAFSLNNADFAPTDLAIELLYLVEANSAAMSSSRRLNRRLQGAKDEAEARAHSDTLTGLQNRRALDAMLKRIDRAGNPFAIMHIDLDFFKHVNDTYGHAAGDHVLQVVSRIMLELTRKDDLVARIGGDEFVIVFPNAVQRDRLASKAATMIAMMERPIPFQGVSLEVSASIGIAVDAEGRKPANEALEQADQALYAAKRAGRAQYALADMEQPLGTQ